MKSSLIGKTVSLIVFAGGMFLVIQNAQGCANKESVETQVAERAPSQPIPVKDNGAPAKTKDDVVLKESKTKIEEPTSQPETTSANDKPTAKSKTNAGSKSNKIKVPKNIIPASKSGRIEIGEDWFPASKSAGDLGTHPGDLGDPGVGKSEPLKSQKAD